jgi:hypothetical protein
VDVRAIYKSANNREKELVADGAAMGRAGLRSMKRKEVLSERKKCARSPCGELIFPARKSSDPVQSGLLMLAERVRSRYPFLIDTRIRES